MTIVFYIAGVIVVAKRRALFSDAFVISPRNNCGRHRHLILSSTMTMKDLAIIYALFFVAAVTEVEYVQLLSWI
jgi:hypothetical protein